MKMKEFLGVILAIVLFSACDSQEYHRISYIKYSPDSSEIYLTDGRAFMISEIDNPYYKNINPEEIKSAKYVYFLGTTMYLKDTANKPARRAGGSSRSEEIPKYIKGSDEQGNVVMDGDIRFEVRELNKTFF